MGQCLGWLRDAWEASAMAPWEFIRDPANAAALQALFAAAVVVLTVFIVWFMARQTGILDSQVKLQGEQTQTQSMLTSLEYAPIIAAEFSGDYHSTANRILLKNGGRGPAHNIRGYLLPRPGAPGWVPLEVKAKPANLNPGDSGEVMVELERVKELRPAFEGVEPRTSDRWVLHYKNMLGRTWHTTCNIDDKGDYRPLGYFRSWSPEHWSALPEDTRKLCWICLKDANHEAAGD